MTCAEDYPFGARLVWKSPPGVRTLNGVFVAPSSRGTVAGHRADLADGFVTNHAIVRFQYKNPTGGISWSEPLELTAGIPCEPETL